MRGPLDEGRVFCALIPSDRVGSVLEVVSGDLNVGNGMPGFSQGGGETRCHRWGTSGGVEPFGLVREFYVTVDGAQKVELREEFRLLFNLAYVPREGAYVDISTGTPDVVARWRDNRMEVKRSWVRRFLAAKGMHLALFFDQRRNEPGLDLGEFPNGAHDIREKRG